MKDKKLKKQDTEVELHKIPLSQVVHTDIDDEVSSVFDRVKAKPSDLVYIVVPHRAVLFQSIVNVKILKRKAKDMNKDIAFITKDKSGVYFANKCNIPVFDQVGENKKEITTADIPDSILTEADRDKQKLSANSGPIKVNRPNISRTSIAELLKTLNYENLLQKAQKFLYKFKRKQGRKNYAKKLLMANTNRSMLIALTSGSILLLFTIVYIALPNATIAVKPNSVPIEQPVNITLADSQRNAGLLRTRPNRVIASYTVNPGIIENSITFDATGNDLTGANSKGYVTITNTVNREFPLKPFTRIQAENGLIFRTQSFVNVPAGNTNTPGTIQIEVVADIVDVNNIPIGERGNLPAGTKFSVPGLTKVNAEEVYAKNAEAFTGGVTSKDKTVTTRDIQAAKELALAELNKAVPKKMQEYLVKMNAERNLNLTLLNDAQVIKLGEPQVVVDESIVGQKMNKFNVVARVEATGLAYDKNELLEILKGEITLRKSPDKALTQIDEDGITYRILNLKEDVGIVEVTATIRGVEQFNLDPSQESAQKLIKKITSHVAGLEISEAEKYIENLPEIESAVIQTWPFWAPTIPSRPESIKIEINETNI
jgi:hypothetical protein